MKFEDDKNGKQNKILQVNEMNIMNQNNLIFIKLVKKSKFFHHFFYKKKQQILERIRNKDHKINGQMFV